MQDELPRGFQARREVGEAVPDGLVRHDGVTERDSLFRIRDGDGERTLGHADALCGDAYAPDLEIRKGDPVPVAFRSETEFRLDPQLVEGQAAGIGGALAEFRLHFGDAVARPGRRNEKRSQTLLACRRVRDPE